jgi:hypothetical protein
MALDENLKRYVVKSGGHVTVLMTLEVTEEMRKLDATRRSQLINRIELLAERGSQPLGHKKYNPDEGTHSYEGRTFKMAAIKTHQVRLYGAYFKAGEEGCFLIGGIDTKKKNNKQKKGVLQKAARGIAGAAKKWKLV